MTETRDDTHPLGLGGERDWVATSKVAAKVIGILASAIVAAVVSYRTAVGDFQARAQTVKDKSEAGYQVSKDALQAHDKRLAELELLVRRLAAQQHPDARRGSRPRALPPAPAAPSPPKALPRDLDQAQRQVYAPAAPPPPPPRGDAAP
jgi:hypothetical protein